MNSYQQALLPQSSWALPEKMPLRLKRYASLDRITALLLVVALLLPVGTVLTSLFLEDQGTLSHLAETVMLRYIGNACALLLGVCVLAFVMGAIPAWLTTLYHFPLAKQLRWLLILPLAMPAYVLAMVYGHLLEPAGPLQSFLREATGLEMGQYPFFDVRSLGGATLMLALALYPYVYILARNAFSSHSCQLLDSARMLGSSSTSLFLRIALPIARPALIVALALVGMETLADFGTVSFYGIESFTTGIYRIWYGMGDMIGAAKLAAILLLFVAAILWIERKSRKEAKYHNSTALYHPLPKETISGWKKYAATLFCAVPVLFGFALPLIVLLSWSLSATQEGYGWLDSYTWQAFQNASIIALSVVALALSLATFFSLVIRRHATDRPLISAIRMGSLGYAIPGSVIAVGILIPMLWFDKQLADFFSQHFNWNIGLLLTGSIVGVVLACTIRFMAIALGSVESALQSVTQMMDEAACVLGACKRAVACRVHLPIIKGGLLTAAIMLFVDTVKELPATILLRPFNMDTLAIRTYELAMDEQIFAAATPALLMVGLSLIPVLLLSAKIGCSRPGNHPQQN